MKKKKKYRVLRVGEKLRATDEVFWPDELGRKAMRMGAHFSGRRISKRSHGYLPHGFYRREVK